MNRLERLRAAIDRLDARLAELLARRAEVVEAIGRAKRRGGGRAFDPGRERTLRERVERLSAGKFPAQALEAVFREIVSASRSLAEPTRVGFVGRAGSPSHAAARHRFGSSSQLAGHGDLAALLRALESGACDYAVVPVDAEAEAFAGAGFDPLLASRARIYGEFRHGGTEPRSRARRGRARRPAGPTKRGRRRYWILSLATPPPSGRDKTAFLAVLPHRPGALHRVLGALARRRLNLVGIETRASESREWAHVFLFELEGHAREKRVAEALAAIRRSVEYWKGLGSFPADPS
jgi:chorismate mutase